ncbi:hypothetical protein [Methylopila sp. Yamaguchi]|uniref:hypothetical protein n=1 Tax=Methylopila sp. Yamaguchi TaxID=1437817 RepID=UPI000CBD8F62|nr:hypothetical protein [Methylopila sp. Yamaguchi]GBD48548.1 hypothetical protein METY_1761 [Methylopila sp. Yamaguchi]
MSATLPTAAFLTECDPPMREALLCAHAERVYRDAARALAPRRGNLPATDTRHDLIWRERLDRQLVRRRLHRLYERADAFGVNVGQPPHRPVQEQVAAMPRDDLEQLLEDLAV